MARSGPRKLAEGYEEGWNIVKGEFCFAPPTWEYTDKQLELMAFMAHRHMPANVSDRLLDGRKVEKLGDQACQKLMAQTDDEYQTYGILWYRSPWEAQ